MKTIAFLRGSRFAVLGNLLATLLSASTAESGKTERGEHIGSINEVPRGLAASGWRSIRQQMSPFESSGGLDSGASYIFAGLVGPAEIAVEQPAGTDLIDGSANVRFGSGLVGSSSQRTFTIRNNGGGDLTSLGINIAGANASDFTINGNPATALPPGGTTTFTVTFSPAAPGGRSAALHIASNDSDESPFDITLTGTGLTPGQIAQQAYLKASNTDANDEFGFSVAASGDTIVVGAWLEDSNATGVNGDQNNDSAQNAGAAYVFVRNGTTWTQQAYLKASNTAAFDQFGYAVAISGDTIVVGADFEDSGATGVNGDQSDNTTTNAGAVYVFVRNGTTWTQQAYLKASNTGGPSPGQPSGDLFGASVDIAGDIIVVGAFNEDSSATGVNGNESDDSAIRAGAAYVFVRNGTAWSQQAYLKASNTGPNDQFGYEVAVSGETVVIGAWSEDSSATGVNGGQSNDDALDSGAAYVFVRNGANWTQQAYLKASNTEANDVFGYSIAISGDTIVVGAEWESSGATGVNGDQNDNSAEESGAAYVFVRNGTTWTQQAYLKASNTGGPSPGQGSGDLFGDSVAISGDIIVVGAFNEDSNATGVNGDQSDDSYIRAGAAYVFVRNGTTWTQHAYLKASNTDPNDRFSFEVALSGQTIVSTSKTEDSNATGVNGDESNNFALESGAAYIFSIGSLTGLESWRLTYFGSSANSGPGADANDFEHDGLTNFVEFATYSNPTQFSPKIGQLTRDGGDLEFTYARAFAAMTDGFIFTVEYSDTLVPGSWSTIGVSQSVFGGDETVQQVKATVPIGTAGQRFMRLKITEP